MPLRAIVLWTVCILSGGLAAACLANDLDDGIEIDDSIEQYSTIGNRPDLNFSYLAQRARSRAATGTGGIVRTREGVLNSVILEPGSQLHGDIVIIDQSRGDKTIIAE
ncbi:hypothetical protein [Desulfobulbus alkaliphilus]|uniref:hypothetical protein n=1 Tax=Desulfobulbus alkaliphilus TaxID=869814 RepID=UPI0019664A89|nr:hypothetical protein [Desulfobulbus alkaliphilus]MBM9536610.1 hypothetical protein [Desulfobulbus alkaliphilus]